jgi:hypothetical protein
MGLTFFERLQQSKVKDSLVHLGLIGLTACLVVFIVGFITGRSSTLLPNLVQQTAWPISLIAVLLFLMGLVGKKLVDLIIHGPNRVLTLGILIILASSTIGLSHLLSKITELDTHVASESKNVQDLLNTKLASLGTPAELIIEDFHQGAGDFYHNMIPIIKSARPRDQILLITPYDLPTGGVDSEPSQAIAHARQEYLDALLERARIGTTYKRIVCFPEGPEKGKIEKGRVPEWTVKHCSEMCALAKQKPGHVSLKKAKKVFDPDLLIIGTHTAVITMTIRDSKAPSFAKAGILIFHDPPNVRIIQELREIFVSVDNHSQPVDEVCSP